MPRDIHDELEDIRQQSETSAVHVEKFEKAVNEADDALDKLNKTQQSLSQTGESFRKRLIQQSRSLTTLSSRAETARDVGRQLSRTYGTIARNSGLMTSGIGNVIGVMSEASDQSVAFSESLESVTDSANKSERGLEAATGVTDAYGKAASRAGKKTSGMVEPLREAAGAFKDVAREAKKALKATDIEAVVSAVVQQNVELEPKLLEVSPNIKLDDFEGSVTAFIKQEIVGPDGETVRPDVTVQDVVETVHATVKQILDMEPDELRAKPQVELEDLNAVVTATVEQKLKLPKTVEVAPQVELEDLRETVTATIEQQVKPPALQKVAPNVELEDFKGVVTAAVEQRVLMPDQQTVKPNVKLEDVRETVTATVQQVLSMEPKELEAKPVVEAEDTTVPIEVTAEADMAAFRDSLAGVIKEAFRGATEATDEGVKEAREGFADGIAELRKAWSAELRGLEDLRARGIDVSTQEFAFNVALEGVEEFERFYKGLSDAEKALVNTVEVAGKLADEIEKDMAAARASVETFASRSDGAASEFSRSIRENVREARAELAELADATDDAAVQRRVKLEVDIARMGAISNFVTVLGDADKAVLEAEFTANGLGAAITDLSKQFPSFTARVEGAAIAQEALSKQQAGLRDEVDEASSVLDLWNKKTKEGADEAGKFAEGLGTNATGAVAAGVALVYLTSKLGELIDKQKDAIVGFAKFRVEADALARTSLIPGGAQQLEGIRQQLGLTTKDFEIFSGIVKSGVNAGIISLNNLVAAGAQLREVFGGDQLERLKEYVDLLQQIPTLETDLAITASLDDQAAAWFAIAEQGKVESVIELQAAGLAGGVQQEGARDQEILNAAQRQEKFMEDVSQTLNSIFGSWSPVLSTIASGMTMALGAIGVIGVGIGAFNVFTAKNAKKSQDLQRETTRATDEAADEITRAIYATAPPEKRPLGGAGRKPQRTTDGGGFFDTLTRRFRELKDAKSPARSLTQLGDSAGKASGLLGKLSRIKVPGMGVLKTAGNTLTAATGAAGEAVGGLAAQVPLLGPMLAKGTASLTGLLTGPVSAAFGGLAAGAVATGGVLLAAVAPIALIGMYGEQAGVALQDFGKKMEDAGGLVAWAGDKVQWFGKKLEFASAVWKDWTKAALDAIGATGDVDTAREEEIAKLREDAAKLEQQAAAATVKQTQRSALALQKALGLIKAASETAKVQLSDLAAEVASLELEMLGEAGGSAMDFRRAVDEGVAGLSRSFNVLNGAFQQARDFVVSNSSMDVSMRRAALLKLNKAELDARKKFLDGVLAQVGEFEQIPRVVENALNESIREARVDLQMEIGAGAFSAVEDVFADLTSSMDSLGAMTNEFARQLDVSARAQAEFARGVTVSAQTFGSELSNLADDIRDAEVGGAVTEVVGQLRGAIDLEGAEITVTDPEAVQTVTEQLQNTVDELSAGLTQIPQGLSTAALNRAEADINNFMADIKQIQIGLDDTQEELSGLHDSSSRLTTLEQELAQQMEEANTAVEKRAVATRYRNRLQAQLLAFARQEFTEAQREGKQRDELLQMAKQRLQQMERTRQGQERALLVNERLLRLAMQAQGPQQALVAARKREEKIIKNYVEGVKRVFSNLNRLVDLIESDPTVKLAQTRLERAEAEQELARATGALEGRAVGVLEARANAYRQQLKVGQQTIGYLEDLQEQGGRAGQVLGQLGDAVRQSVSDAAERLEAASVAPETIQAFQQAASAYDAANRELQRAVANRAGPEETERLAKAVKSSQAGLARAMQTAQAQAEAAGGADVSAAFGGVGNALQTLGNVTEGFVVGFDAQADKLRAQVAVARTGLANLGEGIEDMLGKIEEAPVAQASAAIAEYNQAAMELAMFTGDTADAFGRVRDVTRAANVAFEDAARRIDEARQELEALRRERSMALRAGDVAGAERARLAIVEQEANIQKATAEAVKRRFDAVVDAAEKAKELQMASLDLQQEALDEQASFLSEIGADYSVIFELQKQGISIEREKLRIAQEHLQALTDAGVQGPRLEEARLAVMKQEISLQRKALGAQKDTYEKLLGMAFGALRESRGARGGLMSEQRLLGVGATRVRGRGGMFIEGASKTIQEASNELQTASSDVRRSAGLLGNAAPQQLEAARQMARGAGAGGGAAGDLQSAAREGVKDGIKEGQTVASRGARRAEAGDARRSASERRKLLARRTGATEQEVKTEQVDEMAVDEMSVEKLEVKDAGSLFRLIAGAVGNAVPGMGGAGQIAQAVNPLVAAAADDVSTARDTLNQLRQNGADARTVAGAEQALQEKQEALQQAQHQATRAVQSAVEETGRQATNASREQAQQVSQAVEGAAATQAGVAGAGGAPAAGIAAEMLQFTEAEQARLQELEAAREAAQAEQERAFDASFAESRKVGKQIDKIASLEQQVADTRRGLAQGQFQSAAEQAAAVNRVMQLEGRVETEKDVLAAMEMRYTQNQAKADAELQRAESKLTAAQEAEAAERTRIETAARGRYAEQQRAEKQAQDQREELQRQQAEERSQAVSSLNRNQRAVAALEAVKKKAMAEAAKKGLKGAEAEEFAGKKVDAFREQAIAKNIQKQRADDIVNAKKRMVAVQAEVEANKAGLEGQERAAFIQQRVQQEEGRLQEDKARRMERGVTAEHVAVQEALALDAERQQQQVEANRELLGLTKKEKAGAEKRTEAAQTEVDAVAERTQTQQQAADEAKRGAAGSGVAAVPPTGPAGAPVEAAAERVAGEQEQAASQQLEASERQREVLETQNKVTQPLAGLATSLEETGFGPGGAAEAAQMAVTVSGTARIEFNTDMFKAAVVQLFGTGDFDGNVERYLTDHHYVQEVGQTA